MSRPAGYMRPLRVLTILMLLLGLCPPLVRSGAVAAPFVTSPVAASVQAGLTSDKQTDSGSPAIGRSSYESPLGYSLDWNGDWNLDRSTDAYGLEIAIFETDADLSLQVWGLMQFGGDAAECVDQMPTLYEQVFDITDFAPTDDEVDAPIGPGGDIEFTAFEYTESPRDEGGQRLYLGCQTVTPGESVIVVGLSATAADFADSLDAADTFLDDSLTIEEPSLDIGGFSDRTDAISADIDRFYRRSLRLEGNPYTGPTYRTFDQPTDSSCYSTSIDGGTPNTTNTERYPGTGPAYCGIDETILVDAPWMLTYILPQAGDIALAAVLAHEAGHHLQSLTGWSRDFDYGDPKDTFIAEQQADCLAGAYIHSAVLRGIYTQRDVDAFLTIQEDIGGFEEGVDHGTGEERVGAFELGYDDGFDACGLYDRGN
jgi:predicted metalloprotease